MFSITGNFCYENGNDLGISTETISFKYKGNSFENLSFEMPLDISTIIEGNTYYIKVFENIEDNFIVYDTNYYIVEFVLNDITPTITNVKKYMENGNEITSFVFEGNIKFVNLLTIEADTLPDMGGNGTEYFKFIGTIFIVCGLVLLTLLKKKYRNWGNNRCVVWKGFLI